MLNDVILRASTNIESTFFALNDHLEIFSFLHFRPSLFAFIIVTAIQIQLFLYFAKFVDLPPIYCVYFLFVSP